LWNGTLADGTFKKVKSSREDLIQESGGFEPIGFRADEIID
jgi:hypothetical protein